MKQFTNLKTWLKNNDIYFEKGYSTYDNEHDTHDFVIIPSAFAHIYNDDAGLTFDSDNRLSTYEQLRFDNWDKIETFIIEWLDELDAYLFEYEV